MSGGVLTSAVWRHSTVRSCKYMDMSAKNCKVVIEGARIRGAKGGFMGKRKGPGLYSSLTSGWQDFRLCSKALLKLVPAAAGKGEHHRPLVVDDFGGNYEESFADVQKVGINVLRVNRVTSFSVQHLLDYFTYKAVRTVLAQLSEMNPHQYAWFYNFVVNNKPQDSKFFIRTLVKERQELGERVMVTRLHLFNKWVKKYNHAELHKAISDQNLELLRERLIQTVKFSNSGGDDVEPNPP